MNKSLALRLIHPLSEGDEFANGVTLDRIAIECDERDQRKDTIRLVFSSGIDLVIAHRSTNRAAFKTAHFSVSVEQSGETNRTRIKRSSTDCGPCSPPMYGCTRRVVDAIEAASRTDDPDAPDVDLWLIPGHIGNPLDLSIRTLRVRTIDLVLVEHGGADVVGRLFEQFSLGAVPDVREIEKIGPGSQRCWRKPIGRVSVWACLEPMKAHPGCATPGGWSWRSTNSRPNGRFVPSLPGPH